jgi:hypothetical protein
MMLIKKYQENDMRKYIVLMISVMFIIAAFSGANVYAGDAGDKVKVKKEKVDPTVYIRKAGKKFHKLNCKLVAKGKKGIKLSEAKKKGLEPCKVCHTTGMKDVWVNANSKKFHKKGCNMVKKGAKKMTKAEAKKNKLQPCKLCMMAKK